MIRLLLPPVIALALIAPAEAQSRREMADRLDAVEARMAEAERRALAADPALERVLTRMDALEYQLRELTGEVERLSFENRRLRQQVDALQTPWRGGDADTTGGEAGNGGGPARLDGAGVAVVDPESPYAEDYAAATGVLGGAPAAAATGPDTLFDRAHARLLDGDFGGAQELFRRFVTDHERHARAGDAWYWLGETYFVQGDYPEAADAYIASLRERPSGGRAPDALVRLGASLAALGRTREACDTLSRFNRQFPNAGEEARARAQRERARAGCA